jgi:hypothetical protein
MFAVGKTDGNDHDLKAFNRKERKEKAAEAARRVAEH